MANVIQCDMCAATWPMSADSGRLIQVLKPGTPRPGAVVAEYDLCESCANEVVAGIEKGI